MLPKGIDLLPHEIKHYETLLESSGECTLFLKRDNDAFPIDKPCKVALFGNGARHTVKGGTGSGDVNSHFFTNTECELENNGFEISTKEWLDAYDDIRKQNFINFVKLVKKEAKAKKMSVPTYSVGQTMFEVDYDLPISNYEGDICLYILSRTSGEGADRRMIKGDIYLTDKEVEDILYLNKKFDKFLLVLNVPGPIDLSPVLEVKNILLLSQLGLVTSQVLVDIILGKINPSGKLSTTWAKPEDYPFINEFGDRDDTRYLEGIYVGYRYFNSKNITPIFPFGYGLSYSSFKQEIVSSTFDGRYINIKVKTTNISKHPGKDVVQVYLSIDSRIDTPKQTLVSFYKSKELKSNESVILDIKIDSREFAIFDSGKSHYVLPRGYYVLSLGKDSMDFHPICKIEVDDDIILKEVDNIYDNPDFGDLIVVQHKDYQSLKIKSYKLDKSLFLQEKVEYFSKYQVEIPEFIKGLSLEELIHFNLGDYKTGLSGVIGQNGSKVLGSAGETTLRINSLNKYLTMADGPAGLRIISEYLINNKGVYQLQEDSIWKGIKPYLPGFLVSLLDVKKNRRKKGSRVYQYCTALPIATALAQSFNKDFLYTCGRLVNAEMTLYGIDLWLAPGINIHRNIRCGRNFEYYSEDPYLSSVLSSSLINGVQSENNKICVVKHFVCNNQETNRFNNNSIVSERALREIYLSNFARVIELSNPASIMTSYNLLNGAHTSESSNLLIKYLRCELKYKGLIMTDWIKTGQINDKSSIHPAIKASCNLLSGVNLCMPGSKEDVKDIKKALKTGALDRSVLENNASILFNLLSSK